MTRPLHDAVEAHLDAYFAWVVGGLRNDNEALKPLCDTADALRAALDTIDPPAPPPPSPAADER